MQLWIALVIVVNYKAALGNGIRFTVEQHLIPCEEDWYLFGGMCYKTFGTAEREKWSDAALYCSNKEKRGSLVIIQTQALQDFLTYFLLLHEKSSVWIGLHDRVTESKHIWYDGSVLNYTYWDTGEPSNFFSSSEDCVEMRVSAKNKIGMWNDLSCDEQLPYICQSSKNEEMHNPDPRFCSMENGGGFKYLNSCYHIVTEEKSWNDAEEYCQHRFNGHLVSILNSKSELFLNYLLSKYSKQFWIGIQIQEQMIQRWSSGWRVIFNRFEENENFTGGKCSLILGEKQWTLSSCLNKFPFICETNNKPPDIKKAPDGWHCPDLSKGWKDLDGESCYIIETSKSYKWNDANIDCMTKGGALATIHSQEESDALSPHVIGTHERLFIGLRRKLENKDIFQWIDGSDLIYENWSDGEPNDKKEECGEFWTDSMKWNDVPCNIEKGYVCSAKKIPPILKEKMENTSTVSERLHSHCPSYSAERTALGIFVSVFIVSILVGILIYFNKIPYSSFKNN